MKCMNRRYHGCLMFILSFLILAVFSAGAHAALRGKEVRPANDLKADSMKFLSGFDDAGKAEVGQEVRIKFTARNMTDSRHKSVGMALGVTGPRAIHKTRRVDFLPGKSSSLALVHKFMHPGDYIIEGAVDQGNIVHEADENNNSLQKRFTIIPVQPKDDLKADTIDFESGVDQSGETKAGQEVKIRFTARNMTDNWLNNVMMLLSVTGPKDIIRTKQMGFQSNKSMSTALTHTFMQPGTYTVKGVVDHSDTVLETDENNNTAERIFTVMPAPESLEMLKKEAERKKKRKEDRANRKWIPKTR